MAAAGGGDAGAGSVGQRTEADESRHVEVAVLGIAGDTIAKLRMQPQDPVLRAKKMLQEECGYPPKAQRLLHEHVLLKDRVSVASLPPPRSLTLVLQDFNIVEALVVAVRQNQASLARTLLSRWQRDDEERAKTLVVYRVPGTGDRPLHVAAGSGHAAVCRALLEGVPSASARGRMLAFRGALGDSALQHAAEGGHESICRMLLAAAPDAEVCGDMLQGSVLHAAAEHGCESICRLLLDAAPTPEVRGKMLRAEDWKREVALHHAAAKGHEEVCRMLLDAAPSPEVLCGMLEATNAAGCPALHAAARKGHEKVCRLLLDADPSGRVFGGAMLTARDAGDRDALHHARTGGHENICLLIKASIQGAGEALTPAPSRRPNRAKGKGRAKGRGKGSAKTH